MIKTFGGFMVAWLLVALVMFAGWVTNLIELFQRHSTLWDIVIGVVGIFAAPVGSLRGFGHWFGLC